MLDSLGFFFPKVIVGKLCRNNVPRVWIWTINALKQGNLKHYRLRIWLGIKVKDNTFGFKDSTNEGKKIYYF